MPRFTTIVAVVSPLSTELVGAVAAGAANVSAVMLGAGQAADGPAQRREAWAEAKRRRNVYTLIDFDPLQPLVDAWVGRLGGDDTALEVVAGLVEEDSLAEYVFVADDTAGEAVHWYHGLLGSFAPRRVLAVKPQPASILDALAHLKPSPPFPDSATLAAAALDYVPTGMSTGEPTGPEPSLHL